MPASEWTDKGGLSVQGSQKSAVILFDLDIEERHNAVFSFVTVSFSDGCSEVNTVKHSSQFVLIRECGKDVVHVPLIQEWFSIGLKIQYILDYPVILVNLFSKS